MNYKVGTKFKNQDGSTVSILKINNSQVYLVMNDSLLEQTTIEDLAMFLKKHKYEELSNE